MHLVIGEDSEDVKLGVGGEALTLSHTRDDSCYKCPMAQTCKKDQDHLSMHSFADGFCSPLHFLLPSST